LLLSLRAPRWRNTAGGTQLGFGIASLGDLVASRRVLPMAHSQPTDAGKCPPLCPKNVLAAEVDALLKKLCEIDRIFNFQKTCCRTVRATYSVATARPHLPLIRT
jgi:hypothetical protein